MAIRHSANTQKLAFSDTLFDWNSPYSYALWVYHYSDPAREQIILLIGGTGTYDFFGILSSNGRPFIQLDGGSGGYGFAQATSAFTAGAWVHYAVVRESATSLKLYVNGTLEGTITTSVSGRAAPEYLVVGNDAANYLNARVAHLKMWTRALTQDEVRAEAQRAQPVGRGSLWLFSPFLTASDTRDLSGLHTAWSVSGSPTTEDGPPITWGGLVLVSPAVPVPYVAPPDAPGLGVWALGETALAGGDTLNITVGTASLTQAAHTLSAAGALPVAGAASLTQAAQSITSAGAAVVAGAASLAQDAHTLSATGTVASATITGSASLTQAAHTLSAAGAAVVAGAAPLTQAGHTLSAAGSARVAGAASLTQAGQSLSAAGAAVVAGAAALTQAAQSATAAGVARVTGAASLTQSAHTASAAGAGLVAGAVSLTQAAHTLSATGGTIEPIAGTASLTQAAHTLSAEAQALIAGVALFTQAGDEVVGAGAVVTGGDAGGATAAHTLSAAGAAIVGGSAALTQAAHTLAALGGRPVVWETARLGAETVAVALDAERAALRLGQERTAAVLDAERAAIALQEEYASL